jgi:hypothetical protein
MRAENRRNPGSGEALASNTREPAMDPRPPRKRTPDVLPDSLPKANEPDVLPDSLGQREPPDRMTPDSLPPRQPDGTPEI